jgi:hypothetical protein
MAAEQALAVAKIQAALTIAKASPRNVIKAQAEITKTCQRKKVAECAEWAFKKGTKVIDGPSIKIAQIIATLWGNIRFGFREVGSGPGYIEIEAFAWDLETNTEATRFFRVANSLYTATGGKELSEARDVYENMASVAQRRVRSCIQQVIPDDIFETALEECHKTLKREDPRSIEEKTLNMVVMFDALGISQAELEGLLQHPLKGVTDIEIRTLGKVYRSIADGVGTKEEWFKKSSTLIDAKAKIEAARAAAPAQEAPPKPPAPVPAAAPEQAPAAERTRKPRSDRGVPRKHQEGERKPGEPPKDWRPREPGMEPDEKQNPAPEGWKNVDPKLSYPVPTASQSFDGTNVTSYGAENQTTAPTTETTEPQTQPPFDPIEELYSLADELWGPKAGGMLLGQCKLHGVDLEHLTPETASKMIDALHVLVERLKQE